MLKIPMMTCITTNSSPRKELTSSKINLSLTNNYSDIMQNAQQGYTDFVLDEMVKCVSEVQQPN